MPRRGGSCSAGSGRDLADIHWWLAPPGLIAAEAPGEASGRKQPEGLPIAWLAGRRAASAVAGAVALLAGLLGVGLWSTPAAAAESPLVLAQEELADDGVFVADGRAEVDEQELAESIEEARALGLRLVVVVPSDPQPSATAFARRVQEATDADAAIVFPPEGPLEAHVVDELESASFRAIEAARAQSDPAVAVETFTTELLAEPSRSLPPIVRQLVFIVLLLAFLLAGVVALEQLRRRSIRQEQRRRAPILSQSPIDWRHPTTGTAAHDQPIPESSWEPRQPSRPGRP